MKLFCISVTKSPFFQQNKRAIEFVLKIFLVYGGWRIFSRYCFDLPVWVRLKEQLATATTKVAAFMLAPFVADKITVYPRYLIIKGAAGVYVADLCLSIPAMVIFTAFILIYSGKWQHKLWFVPLGIASIFLINAFRVASMAYIQRYYSATIFEINHSYIYVALVYGFIFLMIKFWMDKFYE